MFGVFPDTVCWTRFRNTWRKKKTARDVTGTYAFSPPGNRAILGRQKAGYGTVVDGFAKFQALNLGISGEGFSFHPAKQGILLEISGPQIYFSEVFRA